MVEKLLVFTEKDTIAMEKTKLRPSIIIKKENFLPYSPYLLAHLSFMTRLRISCHQGLKCHFRPSKRDFD